MVPWHYKSGQSPDGGGSDAALNFIRTMTLQIRAIPRRSPQDQRREHDVPWHYKSGQSPDKLIFMKQQIFYCTMTLQIRAIPRLKDYAPINHFLPVPWHYKSGQSPDFLRVDIDIILSTMTLQIRAIPRPVTTIDLSGTFTVPWHYKSGQSPDWWFEYCEVFAGYHDITNPGNPQTFLLTIPKSFSVPWHYKSGQSPDLADCNNQQSGSTMTLQIRAIPRHVRIIFRLRSRLCTMTLQIRAIPRRQSLSGKPGQTIVPWHYKSGQSPDAYLH